MGKKNKFEKLGVNENYVENLPEQENVKELKKQERSEKKNDTEKFKLKRTKKYAQPEQEKVPVPSVRIKAHILALVSFVLSLVMRLAIDDGLFLETKDETTFVLLYSGIYAFVFAIPSIVYSVARKLSPKRINLRATKIGDFPFVFVSTMLLVSLVCLEKYFFAYTFSYTPSSDLAYNMSTAGILIALCLVPAVFEELLFRGVLQAQYSEFGGGITGIIICAFLFALWHFDLPYFLVYFTAGIVLGVITHVTGSVLFAIFAHFINNAFTYFASGWVSFIASERIGGAFLMIVLCTLCFVLLMIQLQMTERMCMKKAVYYANIENEESGFTQEKKVIKDDKTRFFCEQKHTAKRFFKVLLSAEIVICVVIYTIVVSVS